MELYLKTNRKRRKYSDKRFCSLQELQNFKYCIQGTGYFFWISVGYGAYQLSKHLHEMKEILRQRSALGSSRPCVTTEAWKSNDLTRKQSPRFSTRLHHLKSRTRRRRIRLAPERHFARWWRARGSFIRGARISRDSFVAWRAVRARNSARQRARVINSNSGAKRP